MDEEQRLSDTPTEYEQRLVCFLDLLGFKQMVKKAQSDVGIFNELFESIQEVQANKLKDGLYGQISYLTAERKLVQAAEDPKILNLSQESWPMSVTQFSDSFVISCPAQNNQSCELFLRLVFALHRVFFKALGTLVRGGVVLGPLVHVEQGPLFGPAMNEAYYLESEVANYPRLVFSDQAFEHLESIQPPSSCLSAIFKDVDGLYAANLVTMILDAPSPEDYRANELDQQLMKLEQAAVSEGVKVQSKVAYLRSALAEHNPQRKGAISY